MPTDAECEAEAIAIAARDPLPDRPVARIVKFLYADEAEKLQPGEDLYHLLGDIKAYGVDGFCVIRIEGLPPCRRKTDDVWRDASDQPLDEPVKVPHEHKPWCDSYNAYIPFVCGPHRNVTVNYEGGGTHTRIAWGWDGNREKPSLTPSFLLTHWHCTSDEPLVFNDGTKVGYLPAVKLHFHCFVGDPYGPGTGRFGPGALDILESHIQTRDGRQVPLVVI